MGMRVERLPPQNLQPCHKLGWHALGRVRRRKNRIDTRCSTNSSCIAPRRYCKEQRAPDCSLTATSHQPPMKVAVIYGSESGTAERGIRTIAKGVTPPTREAVVEMMKLCDVRSSEK